MKVFFSSLKGIFLLGALLGAVGFLCIYGFRVLDVTYDGWLMSGSDITQHYLGWKFFRHADWTFPLGLMDSITYPFTMSVMYVDSLPLFAVVFKVFAPILPPVFQYFGLWGLFCFMLHGGLGAVIIRKYTSNIAVCLLSAIFFILSPTVLERMFNFRSYSSHSALGAHWIVLFALLFCVHHDRLDRWWKRILAWCLLFAVCPFVHMYFLPMIGLILVGFYLQVAIDTKNVKPLILLPIFSILSALLSMFVVGGFSGTLISSASTEGFGWFNANLNALFNSQGTSSFFPALPLPQDNTLAYEAYAYLGLGVICLLFLAIVILIVFLCKVIRKEGASGFGKTVKSHIGVALVLLGFAALAVNPTISLNSQVLFTIPWPGRIFQLFSIFRANGRFLWPVYYMIVIGAVRYLVLLGKKTFGIVVLAVCAVLQIGDLWVVNTEKLEQFTTLAVYENELRSEVWAQLAENHSEFFFVRPHDWRIFPLFYRIAYFASDHNMVMSDFHLGRPRDTDQLQTLIAETKVQVGRGDGSAKQKVFVFLNEEEIVTEDFGLHYYGIEGVLIGVMEKIEDLGRYPGLEELVFE